MEAFPLLFGQGPLGAGAVGGAFGGGIGGIVWTSWAGFAEELLQQQQH